MSDPINPYASPLADLTPAPGERWVQDVSPSLRQTGIGLTLVYYGIVLVLLSILVLMFGGFVAADAGGAVFVLVVGAAGIGMVVACILMFVGPLVCLAVPTESGARAYIIGSVVFQLANIGYAVLSQFVPVEIPLAAALILNLLGVVGTVLFILFMKKLAEYIGRERLAARARNLLVTLGVLVVLGTVFVAVAIVGTLEELPEGTLLAVIGVLGLVVIVLGLIVFVMYANLVDALRKALRRKRPLESPAVRENRKP